MAYQFPAPNGDGDEFLAPNNVLYVYNANDGQWEVKGIVDPVLPDPTDDSQQSGTTDDRYVNITGDEMEGPLNVVHPPTEDNHAASKLYVDEKTKALCWEPFERALDDSNYFYWKDANGVLDNSSVKGNKTGSSTATDVTSLEFIPVTDFSKVKVGNNIRLRRGQVIDEYEITAFNEPVISVSLVDQQSSGDWYHPDDGLLISYQVECSLFVERPGDKMSGHLELEDGFGQIQQFDDTTPDGTAVHKKYVDDLLNDKVDKAGDTMSGTLEFNITGTDATAISIKSTEADQNRIISVEGGTGTSDNLSLLLEGDDGSNNFVIRTPAGDCYSISSDGNQAFSSQVTFNDDVIFDFSSKPVDSTPFIIKGKQGNNGTGDNLLKLTRKDDGDQLRYYGGITDNKEIVTKEYVDSLLADIDLSKLGGVPVGVITFWASAVEVPDGWFKLDGSTFDINTYPDLHTYLLDSNSYSQGVLPDYSNRFACHIGTTNNGAPGEKVADKSKKPTGLTVATKTVTFTHTHTITITGTGNHSHSVTVGGGSHTHTYTSFNNNRDGGGTGKKNPDTYTTSTASGGGHTHTITLTGNGTHTHTYTMQSAGAGTSTHSHSIIGGDTTTRPLSVLGYWIIKN